MRIEPVMPHDFHWPTYWPYLEQFAARAGGQWTAQDYAVWITTGNAQCWTVRDGDEIKACLLTQIKTDRTNTVEVIACVGEDRDDWQDLMLEFADSCRARGHKLLRLFARPGWSRIMKPLGFKETHRVLDMEL